MEFFNAPTPFSNSLLNCKSLLDKDSRRLYKNLIRIIDKKCVKVNGNKIDLSEYIKRSNSYLSIGIVNDDMRNNNEPYYMKSLSIVHDGYASFHDIQQLESTVLKDITIVIMTTNKRCLNLFKPHNDFIQRLLYSTTLLGIDKDALIRWLRVNVGIGAQYLYVPDLVVCLDKYGRPLNKFKVINILIVSSPKSKILSNTDDAVECIGEQGSVLSDTLDVCKYLNLTNVLLYHEYLSNTCDDSWIRALQLEIDKKNIIRGNK